MWYSSNFVKIVNTGKYWWMANDRKEIINWWNDFNGLKGKIAKTSAS